ncbi:hypothetical protein PMAYCL1PPCAC_03254, partial [Pristionchus mayeri]
IAPIAMDSPPNLSVFDPSIIERIIRQSEESLEELRLISPVWISAVRDYAKNTKLGAIERVYLYSGVPEDEEEQYSAMSRMRSRFGQNVQMVAILPEKHE